MAQTVDGALKIAAAKSGVSVSEYRSKRDAGLKSGPGARPFNVELARETVTQCEAAGVACFVKQLGAHVIQDGERRRKADKKGGDWHEWPHDIRVRQFPEVA